MARVTPLSEHEKDEFNRLLDLTRLTSTRLTEITSHGGDKIDTPIIETLLSDEELGKVKKRLLELMGIDK